MAIRAMDRRSCGMYKSYEVQSGVESISIIMDLPVRIKPIR
ncbi:MAG: hypothetical protein AB2693_31510 [Candidatus Thiodiazotropha sp.]